MEELKSEKAVLLHRFDKAEDAGMKEVRTRVDSLMQRAKNDVAVMLGEDTPIRERQSIRQQLQKASK